MELEETVVSIFVELMSNLQTCLCSFGCCAHHSWKKGVTFLGKNTERGFISLQTREVCSSTPTAASRT